jgi:hypothetical protein
MPAARVKGGPCPFRRSPFRRKTLTVFDISRSHQVAWMSGFSVEPDHRLRVTSNNRKYPVVKTSVDPRRYEKLAPPAGFEPTAPRGRAGGLARARTAWLYLDGTCMPESARWEAYREEYELHARGGCARTPSAVRNLDGTSRSGRFGRPLRAKSPASARTVGARVYCFNSTKDREKSPIPLVGSIRTVTTPSIRFPLSEATKCAMPVLMIVAPVLSNSAPLHLPPT